MCCRWTTGWHRNTRPRPRSTTASRPIRWALGHAAELGADPSRIGVGGDSAGGNLAALVALRSREEGIPQPALQVLLYPVLDLSAETPSRILFSDGFFLSKPDTDWFTELYLDGTGLAADDPRVSPLKAADLSGLAPALVLTAGFDPLRDEGNEYAAALRSAGVTRGPPAVRCPYARLCQYRPVRRRQRRCYRGHHLGHPGPPQPRLRWAPLGAASQRVSVGAAPGSHSGHQRQCW